MQKNIACFFYGVNALYRLATYIFTVHLNNSKSGEGGGQSLVLYFRG